MPHPDSSVQRAPGEPARQTSATHWSWVSAAGNANSPAHESALAELSRRYWQPVYAFARRLGNSHDDASDLTQGFWTSLLTRNTFSRADPDRGRFRSFLLTCFKNYLHREHERRTAQRRGGNTEPVALDRIPSEDRSNWAPSTDPSPDEVFDRQWALATLGQALDAVRAEYSLAGKAELHDQLRALLWEDSSETYLKLSARFNMTEAAVKMAVLRLRKRCRQALLELIRQTVHDRADIEDEYHHLVQALRR